jgi:hypothetical protein
MANGPNDEGGGDSYRWRGGRPEDRRLDDIAQQLTEARRDVGKLWEEMRREGRSGDLRDARISRLDEKMVDATRRLEEVNAEIDRLRTTSREDFVNRVEFDPVRKAVFAVIATICMAALAAVGRLILK